jgi:anti-sigma regulatory factor (Ser/Thr protein kinase)
MRTGAAARHTGYFHEALCYSSDDEFLTIGVPFLLDGVQAGEPTLLALDDHRADMIRAAMPTTQGLTFLNGRDMYARPASVIQFYRQLLADHVAVGAGQIRILGELTPSSFGVTWDWWARYEAAINHAYDDFPLWTMCAFDTRLVPEPILDDVWQTHPRSVTAQERHVVNARFVDPKDFLNRRRPVADDPIQRAVPVIELINPSPAAARQAVIDADPGTLPAKDIEDLTVAVSEAVTNAICHGRPAVRMAVWIGTDRVIVTVRDAGGGPSDPFAGLLPMRKDVGGLGLWLVHQLCSHVTLEHHDDGFTLRLTAGNPHSTGAAAETS